MLHDAHDWALVLAAGEGSRLHRLTTTDDGVPVPKQFCSLDGGPSLLQEALHRAESVAHFTRVCTVVAAAHRPWWAEPLQMRSRTNVVVQPSNRGTAIGILLPLLHLARRDPRATVALLPSDHFVENERALARALRGAMIDAATYCDDVLLLGIRPDHVDPELGYILPGRHDGVDLPPVARFVEKPRRSDAEQLIDRGALWNSFIVVARLESLLALYERRFGEVLTAHDLAVERELAGDPRAVTDLYGRLPTIDFSRHVLAGQEAYLRVVPVPACGWSDLGTPHRVAAALRNPRTASRTVAPHITPAAILDLAAQHGRLQLAGV
ncbi:MAG TPA: sugar phosphate nucleotidyltransferase [Steroidobacteraceae bacterium]|nr:sugar phosphate nucleotidyltransferase [Steroidobacteraceae bacterium]